MKNRDQMIKVRTAKKTFYKSFDLSRKRRSFHVFVKDKNYALKALETFPY